MPSTSELTRSIDQGRDAERDVSREEIALLLSKIQTGSYLSEAYNVVRELYSRIISYLADRDPNRTVARDLDRVIRLELARIPDLFGGSLQRISTSAVRDNTHSLASQLSAGMLVSILGPVVDAYGSRIPAHSRAPNVLTFAEEDLELSDILTRASPLLRLNGDASIGDKLSVVSDLRGDDEQAAMEASQPAPWVLRDEDLNRGRLPGWDQRVRTAITAAGAGLAAAAIAAYRREDIRAAGRLLRARLGIRTEQRPGPLDTGRTASGGLIRRLGIILRQEALRVAFGDKQRDFDAVDGSILVGYSLHSAHAPATAPDHAARDGWRFYRDDRGGSDLPWAQRIVPPYRINCLCFPRNIYETDGIEEFREWTVIPKYHGAQQIQDRDIGRPVWNGPDGFVTIKREHVGQTFGRPNAPLITPRDIGAYETWFDKQRAGVQRKIIGDRRWFAANLRANTGRVSYADLVRTNGSMLSPTSILEESGRLRRSRTEVVRQVIDRVTQQRQQALRQGAGIFELSGVQEDQMRRRLLKFLDNIEK